jgi:rare lipoprotein A (peptidoglycan hydrolase)
MLAKFFLQYILAAVLGFGVDDGYATLYGTPGDPHAGGDMACNQKPVPQDERLCAHRWLPCGTEVVVVNLERPGNTVCRVTDRGPFGVDRHGRWRGVIDLTPGAANAVRLDGRDLVRLIYRLPLPGHPVYDNDRFLKPKVRRSSAASM